MLVALDTNLPEEETRFLELFKQVAHSTTGKMNCEHKHRLDLRHYVPSPRDTVYFDTKWKN
jgi:hypothetical protein